MTRNLKLQLQKKRRIMRAANLMEDEDLQLAAERTRASQIQPGCPRRGECRAERSARMMIKTGGLMISAHVFRSGLIDTSSIGNDL